MPAAGPRMPVNVRKSLTAATAVYYIGQRSTHQSDNYSSAAKECTRGNCLSILNSTLLSLTTGQYLLL